MSFCIDTSRLVPIRSFTAAEAHYNNTAPIRGYYKDIEGVPLRSDRKNWLSMRLMKRPYGYAAQLYKTDVVQWHADGTMSLDAAWNNRSTNKFAAAHLPYGMAVSTLRGNSVLHCAQGVFPLSYGEVRLVKGTDSIGMPCWEVDTESVPPMCYPKLNLKRAAVARKQIAPLMAYLTTLEAMGPIDGDAWRALRNEAGWAVTTMYDMVTPERFGVVASRFYRIWCGNHSGGLAHRLDPKAKAKLTKLFYELTGCHDTIMLEPGTTHRLMRKYEGE